MEITTREQALQKMAVSDSGIACVADDEFIKAWFDDKPELDTRFALWEATRKMPKSRIVGILDATATAWVGLIEFRGTGDDGFLLLLAPASFVSRQVFENEMRSLLGAPLLTTK
jgi:small ligand-binding sensory domain FIST